MSDPTRSFFDGEIAPVDNEEISLADLYEEYNEWCTENPSKNRNMDIDIFTNHFKSTAYARNVYERHVHNEIIDGKLVTKNIDDVLQDIAIKGTPPQNVILKGYTTYKKKQYGAEAKAAIAAMEKSTSP